MSTAYIVDDRTDPAQTIRERKDRRTKQVVINFPERRSGIDRRHHATTLKRNRTWL